MDPIDDRSRAQRKTFMILVISAYAVTVLVALVSVGASIYLLQQNADLQQQLLLHSQPRK
jgi:hypothetical protein